MKKVILIHKVKILYNEKWENVYYKNKKTIYLISNYGRLKNKKKNKLLKGEITKYGYLRYHITINKKLYHVSAHRLVAKAFIPNPKNKPEVNHKDGNKLNNCITNLEWCTNLYNQQHAWKNGLHKPTWKKGCRK